MNLHPPGGQPAEGDPGIRRAAWALILAIAIGYGALAFLLPHPYPSFDEAKYLAIGRNALAGLGPLTAFGDRFLPHSPFWPMVFAAPDVVLHLDSWTWGYLLNALTGIAVLLLAARIAWRFGPLAAVLTVGVLAGWIGLFQLTRTARLDVPEAALALAYLGVASSAIETGLVRRGVLAGALFAWAFLTKEASLVLLAAPFVAALAERRPVGRIALAAGLVLLASLPLMSWWFVWYADATGRVFALGLDRSLLGPLGAALLVGGALLVTLAVVPSRPGAALRGWIDARLANRPTALAVAAVMAVVWVLVFLIAFARADVQAGRPLFDVPQLTRWVRTWASDLAGVTIVGLGAVVAVGATLRGDDRPIGPLAAFVVGLPWLLLVAVLGEPPRNDIAELALIAAAGAGGWLILADALRGRDRSTMFVAAVLAAGGALAIDALAARAGIATRITKGAIGIGGSMALGAAAGAILSAPQFRTRLRDRLRQVAGGRRVIDGRAAAVALVVVLALGSLGAVSARVAFAGGSTPRLELASAVAQWLEANLPSGATVMFGSVQANETALVLDGRYQLRHLQATIGVTATSAPLGIAIGGKPVTDLVVMDPHPRQHGFLVFTASMIRKALDAADPVAIVYVTGIDTATPSMLGWLASAPGVSIATTINAGSGATTLVAHIYRIDMRRLEVPSDHIYASAGAIKRLLDDLGQSPSAPLIAASFVRSIVLTDAGSESDAVMARLRAVAAH